MMSTEGREGVYVNIYDMYSMNNYTAALGVGIYHCGVEVYGVEYGYGGHPFPFSGIFEMNPKDHEELGETFRFKETIEIGRTDFNKDEIEQIVGLLGRDFRGVDYHLMNKNCNSFSSKFSKLICGEDIPPWVNRLAYLTTFIPFIEKMVPKEWISPAAIQHTLDQHKEETGELTKQNGASLTRTNPNSLTTTNTNTTTTTTNPTATLIPDNNNDFSSIINPLNSMEQEQEQGIKSKISQWTAIFTNGGNENSLNGQSVVIQK